jgi:hypothetical protein
LLEIETIRDLCSHNNFSFDANDLGICANPIALASRPSVIARCSYYLLFSDFLQQGFMLVKFVFNGIDEGEPNSLR